MYNNLMVINEYPIFINEYPIFINQINFSG